MTDKRISGTSRFSVSDFSPDMELQSGCVLLDEETSHFYYSSSPKGSCSFFIDEDSGLGMDFDVTSPQLEKRSLPTERNDRKWKRPAENHEDLNQIAWKRHRSFDAGKENEFLSSYDFQATDNNIIDAVELLTRDCDVTADGSHANILPTIHGKHSDLNTVSSDTVLSVLSGGYKNIIDHVTIIDCRYPYEYQAGHIKNAINLYTKEGIISFLKERTVTSSKNHVLIFHCEFSSKRGPKLCRFLRSQDRELNKDRYPQLYFPEIYLLEGGYKDFYTSYKELCFPQDYKPMLDKAHTADLRHFRVKSKSWAAGDKPHYKSGLQRLKLIF